MTKTTDKFAGLGLSVDAPHRMTIIHPITRHPLKDKDGNEAWIDLYSRDSERLRQYERDIARRRMAAGAAPVTPEEIEADSDARLAVLTADWRIVGLNGVAIDVPCTKENATQLYAAPGSAWLREQVAVFVADRGNFATPLSGS